MIFISDLFLFPVSRRTFRAARIRPHPDATPPQTRPEGREAVEATIPCAVTAIVSSTVTLVAYVCYLTAGDAGRKGEWADTVTSSQGSRKAVIRTMGGSASA